MPTLRAHLGSNLVVELVVKTRTQGEEHYALDTICNSAGAVADWRCQQLHARWVHSHSARARDRRAGLPIDQRAKDRCLVLRQDFACKALRNVTLTWRNHG